MLPREKTVKEFFVENEVKIFWCKHHRFFINRADLILSIRLFIFLRIFSPLIIRVIVGSKQLCLDIKYYLIIYNDVNNIFLLRILMLHKAKRT